MEHSKLPWKTGTKGIVESGDVMIQASDGHATWVARVIGGIPTKEQKANAAFIVTACNEHDMLKAKAELLDEVVAELTELTTTEQDSLCSECNYADDCTCEGEGDCYFYRLDILLAKINTKGLK